MNIYVAGSTADIQRVRIVQRLCRVWGHQITYDWTVNVEEVGGAANEHDVLPAKQKEFALADYYGVRRAQRVIALVDRPNLGGTLKEIGMAMAWQIPVWALGTPYRHTVFYHIDELVTLFEGGVTDAKFLEALSHERRVIMGINKPTFIPLPSD